MQASNAEKAMDWPLQNILVIDDDVELCALVAEYLRPEGF